MGSPQKAAGGIGKVTLPCRYRTDAGVPGAASEADAATRSPMHVALTRAPIPRRHNSLALTSIR